MRIDYPDTPDTALGHYRGSLDRLLVGIDAARLDNAVLALDGNAEELHALVDQRAAGRPELVEENRLRREGTRRVRRFGGEIVLGATPYLFLPIEADNIAAVRAVLDRHADAEDAPDIDDSEIRVSGRIPEGKLDALRTALGEDLDPA